MTRSGTKTSSVRRTAFTTAFTLVEMLTSLVIISILMLATSSAIVLVCRAMPGPGSTTARLIQTTGVLDQLGGELAYATGVSELGATSITFTVPDRTGDGVGEVVRYAWDAKPGAPLTRSFNGSMPKAVLDDVHDFHLLYDRRRERLPTTWTLSSETLLFNQDALANLTEFTITSSNWVGQSLRPSTPSKTAWWRITRVLARARSMGTSDGETRVQIRDADLLGNPGTSIMDQAVLRESALGTSFQWREFTFTRDVRFAPGAACCLVFQWVRDAEACNLQVRSLWAPGGAVATSTGGAAWSALAAHSLVLQVYGVTATEDPPRYRYSLNDVRVSLRAGEQTTGSVTTTIVMSNVPEVPAP